MKPGLYVATVRGVEGVTVMAHDDGDWFCTPERVKRTDHHMAEVVTDARPLVVLDPESDEDCRRLADVLNEMDGPAPVWMAPQVRTLLRALAAPTPAEPMGLGAVVKDSRGTKWIRHDSTPLRTAWINTDDCHERYAAWSDIDVAEVLSEGWSE